MLNVKKDLIGKTITGIIAVPGAEENVDGHHVQKPNEIWMMQFSDGSHVEFVSPGAKRGLRRSASRNSRHRTSAENSPQLALNVA
ncbi:MAG TPA: hypothetical protein VJ984_08690 [Xanthomonadales bacterium]|nr:hypothetical protein [Xanthomonadales bacterium]